MPLRLSRQCVITVVGIAVALLALVAATLYGYGRASVSAQSAESWPAFTMTWRETGNGLGLNGARGTQLFRLEYTDRRHFRTTLLENPTVPDAVGSTWIFDGQKSTFHDARHQRDQVTTYKPDELTVPAEWLAPGQIAYLLKRPGYTMTPLANGLAMLTHEETTPAGQTFREETTYRMADGIPTLRVTTVNGVEVDRKEVVEFHLAGS